jgi:pantothenate kinase
MDASLWAELSSKPLTMDQTGRILTLDQAEVGGHYLPLVRYLLTLPWRDSRQVIAIAGPPGCGKSSFSAVLNRVINLLSRREICAVVGQDGWHYPNHYLATHRIQKDDRMILLREIKGAPETFDIDGLLACLHQIKTQDEVRFPIYSRELHDPLPDAGRIKPEHRIILLEGNYLLLNHPGWRDIHPLTDRSIFLSAPVEILTAALRERHLRGSKDPQSVENHLRTVDLPNVHLVLESSKFADILVEKADPLRIARIILP